MTCILHTASISNVERVMCVKRLTKIIKSELVNEIKKDCFWSYRELSTGDQVFFDSATFYHYHVNLCLGTFKQIALILPDLECY